MRKSTTERIKKDFIKEWDFRKNGDIENCTKGAKEKVWWICPDFDHNYEATSSTRIQGHGCPYCANILPYPGFNDLSTLYPEVAKCLSNKNKITAKEILPKTKKVFIWDCLICGYEFETSSSRRVLSYEKGSKEQSCPYCSGWKPRPGVNDLLSQMPGIEEIWDYDKNKKNPEDVTYTSSYNAYFVCKHGHNFQRTVAVFYKNKQGLNFCPTCDNRNLKSKATYYERKNVLSIADKEPRYRDWWNDKIDIDTITNCNAAGQYSWKCPEKGHVFNMTTKYMNFTCPICEIEKISIGAVSPELSIEYSDNNDVPITLARTGSDTKYEWVCLKDRTHPNWFCSYRDKIKGRECPVCNPYINASIDEKELLDFLKDKLPQCTFIENDKNILSNRQELDIYIKELNIGIEFNGEYWHDEKRDSNIKRKHDKKELRCKNLGIRLLVVWEEDYNERKEEIQNMLIESIVNNVEFEEFTYQYRRDIDAAKYRRSHSL